MKVQIKSKEQLLAEGWIVGGYRTPNRSGYGIFSPHPKNPEHLLTEWQMGHLLGKEAEIVNYEMKEANPTYQVKCQNHTSWVPWKVIQNPLGLTGPKISRKEIKFPMGEVTIINGHFFKFDCDMSEMTKEQVQQVIRKLAPLVGMGVLTYTIDQLRKRAKKR